MKMRFHSHGNEFDLHVNEISFSYERMSTKTRFGKEAKGNSEMAYSRLRKFSTVAWVFQILGLKCHYDEIASFLAKPI